MNNKTWSPHEVLKSADLNNQFIYIISKCLGAYSATVSYDSGDIVRDGTTNNFYKSIVDDNLGNALGNNSSWQFIVSLDKDYATEITGTDIDWNESSFFYKFVSGSPTFTFSNEVDNKRKITVVITDTDSGSITWPSNIVWDNGGAVPSQTSLKTDIYEFIRVNNTTFGKRVYVNMTGSWPYGVLGDLHVTTLNTPYELPAGAIYDYNNVEIDSGCKLVFTGNTVNFTILGVKGNLINKGTIEAKNSTAVGSASTTAPDGVALSATIAQKNGGAGGAGGDATITLLHVGVKTAGGASGGAQSSGNGGYGGGGGGCAGIQGTSSDFWSAVNGSTKTGGYATITYGATTNWARGGSGSNGGAKGLHGKNLYIRCKGVFDGTGGTIDVGGSAGSNGVNGGNGSRMATMNFEAGSGAGGSGGGAGGSAGKVYIRHHTDGGDYTAPTFVITGGAAGTGGTKGSNAVASGGSSSTNAVNGSNGTAGDAGSTDIAGM